jgi:hypothetical protein
VSARQPQWAHRCAALHIFHPRHTVGRVRKGLGTAAASARGRMDDSGSPPPHHDDAIPGAEPTGTPGYVCLRCGGALWKRRDGERPAFECRIGHAFEALELWVAHCTVRNAALEAAARALAENAALARKLAFWSRERGNVGAAARIEEEAAVEEQYYEQVRSMLEGLEPINSPP